MGPASLAGPRAISEREPPASECPADSTLETRGGISETPRRVGKTSCPRGTPRVFRHPRLWGGWRGPAPGDSGGGPSSCLCSGRLAGPAGGPRRAAGAPALARRPDSAFLTSWLPSVVCPHRAFCHGAAIGVESGFRAGDPLGGAAWGAPQGSGSWGPGRHPRSPSPARDRHRDTEFAQKAIQQALDQIPTFAYKDLYL